jgi:hypothetical protein
MESAVAQAADQMEQAGKNLQQVTLLMKDQEITLDSLSQEYADPSAVTPPMPISE